MFFFRLNSLVVALILFVVVIGATALGHLIGRSEHKKPEGDSEPFGVMQAAMWREARTGRLEPDPPFIVDDLDAEIARLTDEGVSFRNEVVSGPGGAQVLAIDPSGNFVELFQPAAAS